MDEQALELCAVCGGSLGPGESLAFFQHLGVYVHPGCLRNDSVERRLPPVAVATRPGGALRCVKCGDLASGRARGWRAYIAEPDEDDLFEYVVVYCPRCGEREFGPLGFE